MRSTKKLTSASFRITLYCFLHFLINSSEFVHSSIELNVCCSTKSGFDIANKKCSEVNNAAGAGLAFAQDLNLIGFLQNATINPTAVVQAEPIRLTKTLPKKCSTQAQQEHLFRLIQISINGKHDDDDLLPGFGQIRSNGYLIYENYFYSPTDYCINGFNELKTQLEIVICKKECKSNDRSASTITTTCLPKCCEIDQLIDTASDKFSCIPVLKNHTWAPILHNHTSPHAQLTEEEQAQIDLHFRHAHPRNWCKTNDGIYLQQRDLPTIPKFPFRIAKDGGIYYQNQKSWEKLSENSFCIDGVYDDLVHNSSNPHPELNISTNEHNVIYYCPPLDSSEGSSADYREEKESGRIILYYTILIISSLFLLFTIIIHGLTLDRSNVHGRTLLCFFISLFCMYIFLAMLHTSFLYMDKGQTNRFCWAIGVCLHFLYLSTFSWLSVVNFDLWFTFRTLRTLIAPKSHMLKRFILYTLFAVGTPIIILTIGLILDSNEINDIIESDSNLIMPAYGQDGCFLTPKAQFVYLYGPIGFLLIINISLFILTIRAMYKLKKTSSMATNSSNNSQHAGQSFHLFVKLFILMGVCWIFEVISWAVDHKSVSWYFIIFDLINILQGVFIFVIFICKRSTVRVMEQKYPCLKGLQEFIASVSCLRNCASCISSSSRNRSDSTDTNAPQELTDRKLSDTDVTTIPV